VVRNRAAGGRGLNWPRAVSIANATDIVAERDAAPRGLTALGHRLRRSGGGWAFALYLATALALEHRALAHLDGVCACTAGSDPTEYMWAMVWFPHAILHGLNPFVTHELWSGSSGFDLARATFTPAEALLAWPITALAGPVVAFNVLAILAPAVGGWAAYRLCFYVTKHPAASLLGGYLFGFSTYELGQLLGHLQLSITFVIPVAVLLTLERIDHAVSRRRFIALMTALLVFELLTSTEVLLSFTLFGAATLAFAWATATPGARQSIGRTTLELLVAYALMAAICSPYLYYALSQTGVSTGPISADLLSFVIPTWITGLGSHAFYTVSSDFPGNIVEQGTYLGLPLITIVIAQAVQAWHQRATRILITALVVIMIAALGDHLYVDGARSIALPWILFSHVPLLKLLITARFGVYIALLSALIAALWLAAPSRHRGARWALAGLAVAFLIPNFNAYLPRTSGPIFTTRLVTPQFFSTRLYRHYLRPGAIVLPLPYGSYGYSLLWQAETDMYFRLASGRFPYPPSGYPQRIARELMGQASLTPDAPALLRSLIVRIHVSDVVADPRQGGVWLRVLASLGLRPTHVGGVLLYRIPSAWHAGTT
jgi:hypothetical protein